MGVSTIFHPEFKAEPYWWEAAAPTSEGSDEVPRRTEVLVVGAGYAGLNAALELARAGREVTVVDAKPFGWGASSRNGGAVSSGVNLGKGLSGTPGEKGRDPAGKAMIDALLGESARAIDHVSGVIEREGIACHWERCGRFVGAYTPQHYDSLARKAQALAGAGDSGVRVVGAAEQRQAIGSDYYYGGMLVERAGKLHPALYHRGLLDACRRAGAGIVCDTPVSAIRRNVRGSAGRFEVETTAGRCRAEEVVVATNGYTGALTPRLRRRIVSVASHIIATEPLPAGLAQRLVPSGRTLSETPRVLHYYRLSPDGTRMIFGGRARFTEVGPRETAPLLHRQMVARFPELAEIRVSHSWSGLVAFTMDAVPHLGVDDGVHYALGCNGSGVAMLSYLGWVVARRIVTEGAHDSAYAGRPFPAVPVPLYSGNPWFLPLVGAWYRHLDRRERRRAAPAAGVGARAAATV